MIARDQNNIDRSVRCTEEGYLISLLTAKYVVIWRTTTDFNKGTY